MDRTIIEVPVISDTLRRIGAPVAALVRANGMLYTCGMPPIDLQTGDIVSADIETQTRLSLEALAFALETGGGRLADTVRATVYLTDPALTGRMNSVYRDYFPNGFPARSCVGIGPWPGFDIEIECTTPIR
ncbi:RidA family protein [Paenirhodobacter enshiensis]|uniref:RidA family protein n=1 Tax=Paenirhodobacter enshiensis TaxID=1105367 RepID=UPI003FA20E66